MQSCRIAGALALALVFGAGPLQLVPAGASDAIEAQLKLLEAARPGWLPSLDTCPADVMPEREVASGFAPERCAEVLDQCLHSCRSGHASDCYASALVLQKVRNNPVSEALYLRSCALGIVSGCTNRAAAMDNAGEDIPCAVRTYGKACDHDDPWACTMMGLHLVRGIGIAKDHERAKRVLSKACRDGDSSPACRSARHLLKEAGG